MVDDKATTAKPRGMTVHDLHTTVCCHLDAQVKEKITIFRISLFQ